VFPDDRDPPTYDVVCWFWTVGDDIRERGDRDRVPYALWRDQGFLEAPAGRAIDKGAVVQVLAEVMGKYDVRGIAYDRWRIAELQKLISDEGLDVPLIEWGQGFKDMSPAVDALESVILDGRLRHGGQPVLRWCAANASVTADPAGNRKLDKAKSIGRIDGVVALAMAVGLADRAEVPIRSPYLNDRPGGFLFV